MHHWGPMQYTRHGVLWRYPTAIICCYGNCSHGEIISCSTDIYIGASSSSPPVASTLQHDIYANVLEYKCSTFALTALTACFSIMKMHSILSTIPFYVNIIQKEDICNSRDGNFSQSLKLISNTCLLGPSSRITEEGCWCSQKANFCRSNLKSIKVPRPPQIFITISCNNCC